MVTQEQLAQAILELKSTQEQTSRDLLNFQKHTTSEVEKLSQYIGSIGKNQGSVAEEFFINSISPTLKVGEIQYDELYKNLYKKLKKQKVNLILFW